MPEGTNNHHKTLKTSIITVLIVALATAIGLVIYSNHQSISDYFSALTFSASPEVSAVESHIQLTDQAKTIFYASHPSLDSQDEFNNHCNSHNEEISVLGCYTNQQIYIYNIQDEELKGVIESTAAHELLHAAWQRMNQSEKSNIAAFLTEVYNDTRYHKILAEDLGTYAESERIEELHSRIGTEIADLPAELESHYAKFFKDQNLVVDYYNQYITPFNELSKEIDNLAETLKSLNQTIEQKSAEYYQLSEELSKKIEEFNSCANTPGCFATEYLFTIRRNVLVAEQSALEVAYEAVNQLIEQYNAIVAEYNENVLRGQTLERIINSNKSVEEIKQ